MEDQAKEPRLSKVGFPNNAHFFCFFMVLFTTLPLFIYIENGSLREKERNLPSKKHPSVLGRDQQ